MVVTQLHNGSCRTHCAWSLNNIRDWTSGNLKLCCIYFNVSIFNLSIFNAHLPLLELLGFFENLGSLNKWRGMNLPYGAWHIKFRQESSNPIQSNNDLLTVCALSAIKNPDGALLVAPRSRLETEGDRAFAMRAPTPWNSLLPTELRHTN